MKFIQSHDKELARVRAKFLQKVVYQEVFTEFLYFVVVCQHVKVPLCLNIWVYGFVMSVDKY